MNPLVLRRMPRTYWGDLVVASFLGYKHGERTFGCFCACGAEVVRTESQLVIRKLQRCPACSEDLSKERQAERSSRKERGLNLKKAREAKEQHAHHQSVGS